MALTAENTFRATLLRQIGGGRRSPPDFRKKNLPPPPRQTDSSVYTVRGGVDLDC